MSQCYSGERCGPWASCLKIYSDIETSIMEFEVPSIRHLMKCTIQVHKLNIEFVLVFFPAFYNLKKENKKPTYRPILKNVGRQQQTKNFLSLKNWPYHQKVERSFSKERCHL
jgi:hypothetical protein